MPSRALGWAPPTSDEQLKAAVGADAGPEFCWRSGAFARKKPPGNTDWLSSALGESDLRGQTFEDFLTATGRGRRPSVARAARDMPTPERKTIYVCAVGPCPPGGKDDKLLATIIEFVEAFYTLSCKRAAFGYEDATLAQLEDSSATPRHRVLNSSRVKAALNEAKAKLPDAFAVLGVCCAHEVAESGFVALGEACQKRHVAFANLRPVKNDLRTSLKVVVHEIGHLLQCEHCVHYECVMNGSNTMKEQRSRPLHLCPLELRKVASSINHAVGGFDVVARYNALAAFYRLRRLEAEATWAERRADEVKRAIKSARRAAPTNADATAAGANEAAEPKVPLQRRQAPVDNASAAEPRKGGKKRARATELKAKRKKVEKPTEVMDLLSSDAEEEAAALPVLCRVESTDVPPLAERIAARMKAIQS